MESRDCPLCQADSGFPVWEEGGHSFVQCRSCSLVYDPIPGEPSNENYWGEGPPDPAFWIGARTPAYRSLLRHFHTPGTLLDFGCGIGTFCRLGADRGWTSWGIEPDKRAADHARNRYELGDRIVTSPDALDHLIDSVDLITLWDVIEHLPDPSTTLKNIFGWLRPGGVVFIRTPNIAFHLKTQSMKRNLGRTGTLEPGDHLQHFSMETIEQLLEKCGFSKVRPVPLPPTRAYGPKTGAGWALAKELVAFGLGGIDRWTNLTTRPTLDVIAVK